MAAPSSCNRGWRLIVLVFLGAFMWAACGTAGRSDTGATPTRRSDPGAASSTSTLPTLASSTTTAAPPSAPTIEVGPGPQAAYTVQPQPAAGSCHYRTAGVDPLPDPRCTPGATNPLVTQSTVSSTICAPGYSASIRPPESITEPEKVASAAAYGYAGSFHTGQYDHLIPLELGGDPNDPANLWVEPNDRPGATTTENSKDALESRLHDLVCSGRMSLATAQQAIASDWVAAFQTYG